MLGASDQISIMTIASDGKIWWLSKSGSKWSKGPNRSNWCGKIFKKQSQGRLGWSGMSMPVHGKVQDPCQSISRRSPIENGISQANVLGVPCHLTVKTYPGTCEILGMYNQEHTHEIGDANVKFTHLPKDIKDGIAHLLELGVQNGQIVCKFHSNLSYAQISED
jgi:hypothetical protein